MIRDALQRNDTAGILLREDFLTFLEILDSVCEVVYWTNLDWALLMKLDPKRTHKKKLLAKKWLIENAYDELFEAIYAILEEPDEVPELDENKLVDQASISATQDDSDSTDSFAPNLIPGAAS